MKGTPHTLDVMQGGGAIKGREGGGEGEETKGRVGWRLGFNPRTSITFSSSVYFFSLCGVD